MSDDPVSDPERLEALRKMGLLDTPPSDDFDQLAATWAKMLDAPVALVSLVDKDRQYFKSIVGHLPEPWATQRQTPLSHSFCQHVVRTGEALIVSDARTHPLLKDSPAIADLGVVAYAGLPLISPAGHVLGALCFIDTKPRDWQVGSGKITLKPRTRDEGGTT